MDSYLRQDCDVKVGSDGNSWGDPNADSKVRGALKGSLM